MSKSLMALIAMIAFLVGALFACIGNDPADCGAGTGRFLCWTGSLMLFAGTVVAVVLRI